MEPRIERIAQKKLMGSHLQMSLSNNKTAELWRSFMPRLQEISNRLHKELFAVQIYNASYFEAFTPTALFQKWAAVEVSNFDHIPDGMEGFLLEAGLYAVFDLKGQDPSIFDYIFMTWLPNSKYRLDHRPHFEILGEKYKKDSPDSEEEIWIPIKLR